MKDILVQLALLSFAAFLLIVLQIIQTGKVIDTKSSGSIASTALSDSAGSDASPDSSVLPVLSDKKRPSGGGAGRIPGEFAILLIIIFCYFGGLLLIDFYGFKEFHRYLLFRPQCFSACLLLAYGIPCQRHFPLFLYLVRRLKQRNLIRTSLIYRICHVFGRLVKKDLERLHPDGCL